MRTLLHFIFFILDFTFKSPAFYSRASTYIVVSEVSALRFGKQKVFFNEVCDGHMRYR